MRIGDFTLQVIVNGEPLPERAERDTGDRWVIATKDTEFSLLVANGTPERVRVVPSVDGLCALDAEPAAFDSPGYVLQPRGQTLVPGWRIDDATVARFLFEAREQAYAHRAGGDPRNVGVIAAAFFGERVASPAELLAAEVAQDVSACWAKRSTSPDSVHQIVCARAAERRAVWERAASGGNVGAWWLVAVCRLYRVPHGRRDHSEQRDAVRLLRRSAENGFPLAQYSFAWCYEHGLGVGRVGGVLERWFVGEQAVRLRGAAAWYRRAAKHGVGAPEMVERSPNRGKTAEVMFAVSDPSEGHVPFAVPRRGDWVGLAATRTSRQPEPAPARSKQEPAPAELDVERQSLDDVAVAFGRPVRHDVRHVAFECRSATPDAVLAIRYSAASASNGRAGCPIPADWEYRVKQ